MKKLNLLLVTILLISSCNKKESMNYLTLSGKINNNKDSIISIYNRQGPIKTIKINADGSFKDTLKVNDGAIHTFATSNANRAPIFLKNGYDIVIKANANAKNFMDSFVFSGAGSSNSNFILAQIKQGEKLGDPQKIIALDKENFTKKIDDLKFAYDSILNAHNNIDSTLLSMVTQQNEQVFGYFESQYAKYQIMGKGKPSPKFENYVDIKGGVKSLDSFKGKYVYIDVWATWCGPCIQQIPFLQNLEKDYKNKNIEFVSISTDESRRNGGSWEAAEKKWRNFVKEKDMSGVQLWSGQDFSFQQAYQITGIPRFILIDPKGNIVDAEAPRPSDPNLKLLFDSLGI